MRFKILKKSGNGLPVAPEAVWIEAAVAAITINTLVSMLIKVFSALVPKFNWGYHK
jgi:hypothetical protein